MAESSGLQGLDTLLKATLKTKLNEGCDDAFALQTLLLGDVALDFPDVISRYLDRIVNTFSSAKGLMSLLSSASKFEKDANPLVKGLGGIDLLHSRKHVKDNRNSCSQSPSRSARPRSRSPPNVFEGSVSRDGLGKGKQKCHEFADWWENECLSLDMEQPISRKGKREKERATSRRGKRGSTPTLTTNVPANNSEAGNDIPPEDGYTWCKYGQKEILGYVYPRMYYKCSFHKDRGCKAKKIAQISNSNPSVFQVIHRGNHSCQRDAQFSKNPFPISEIQDDGGKDPSYSRNVDSSAQRAMAFTGHSADQMYRFQGSEKEGSSDFIPSPQQNEGPSNCQPSLPPPTNPRMQLRDSWLEFAEAFGTDSDADLWPSDVDYLVTGEMGMPLTNSLLQNTDTSESDIAAVVSTTDSAV